MAAAIVGYVMIDRATSLWFSDYLLALLIMSILLMFIIRFDKNNKSRRTRK